MLFTADHGEMLGDHGLSQKNCPYEPSVRVPLLLRWPGRTHTGATCDDPVGLTDVLPTLVAELGLDYPAGQGPLPGESLLGAPGGGLASGRTDYVIDYSPGARRWIAVRTRRHKYALFACDGGREELYELHADPRERHNLAAAESELTAALRERAVEWERPSGTARAPAEAASFSGARFRYLADSSQGPVDTVIAAMEANHPHLTTQSSFYVEISGAGPRRACNRPGR